MASFLPRTLRLHLKPQLRELYWFSIIFSFASALITIFEPVFFYQESFSFSAIAAYYALHYTLYVFILPLGGKFTHRFGLERSLALSMPIFVMYFLVLAAIPWYRHLFWLAWALLAIHKIFYWPAYHAEFAKFGDRQNRGAELSWIQLIVYGLGIIGPLLGGFIASLWGFSILFVIAAATALAASLPLLLTKEKFQPRSLPYAEPWRQLFQPSNRRVVLGMMGMGEELIHLVYWPIFMFIIIGSTSQLGAITAATIGLMSIVGFFIGELTDHYSRRGLLRVHLPFLVLSFLFRPLAASPIGMLLTDLLGRLAFIGTRIPMLAGLYSTGQRIGPLKQALVFEMALVIAKAITAWTLVLLFAITLPYTGLTIAFGLAAILALLYWWL